MLFRTILFLPCTNVLIPAQVTEKGPLLSVVLGLTHICICTMSEMLYQDIRTLWGNIMQLIIPVSFFFFSLCYGVT